MKTKQGISLIAVILLIFVTAACERTVTNSVVESTAQDCFSCHSDQNTILVAVSLQWVNSIHASGDNIDRGGSCSVCHQSEGFVASVTGTPADDVLNPTAIHCFTCHAPHTNGDLSLRVTDPVTLQDGTVGDINSGNICLSCHQSRRNVNTYITDPEELSEHWGPHHSPQGDMLFATNGYEYDNFTYGDLIAHRTLIAPGQTENDGCLECHFKTTKNNVVGGHAFNMEAETIGTGEEVINNAACENCHFVDFDDFNYAFVQDSVTILADSLAVILDAAGLIHDGHPLDDVFTSADSAGAVWNWLMAEEDRSEGVHNSRYIIDLLESAIMYMEGNLPQPSSRRTQTLAGRKPDDRTKP